MLFVLFVFAIYPRIISMLDSDRIAIQSGFLPGENDLSSNNQVINECSISNAINQVTLNLSQSYCEILR